jgi:hypothetical protein
LKKTGGINVLKVVLDKPEGTIRAEEVKKEQIVVAKFQRDRGLIGGPFKLHVYNGGRDSGKFGWFSFAGSRYTFHNPHESIAAAIKKVTDAGGQVFVLSSLRELADWIRDNADGGKFKVGAKVRITGNKSDHDFHVGDVGVIAGGKNPIGCGFKNGGLCDSGWLVEVNRRFWYVHESDMEVLS